MRDCIGRRCIQMFTDIKASKYWRLKCHNRVYAVFGIVFLPTVIGQKSAFTAFHIQHQTVFI